VSTCKQLLQKSEADYTLEVQAVSYSNPRHRVAGGRCCDRFDFNNCGDINFCHYCSCDNVFFFCLRRPGTDRDGETGNCPLGSYSLTEPMTDSFYFNTSILGNGVPNPMLFQGSVWPVSTGFRNSLH
jgi:hypothetical protein